MKNIRYAIGLIFIVMFFGVGYSIHALSEVTGLSITGVFGNVPARNWTAPNVTETVNFTIKNNDSSNDSVISINITLPSSGFTLINSTINNSLYADWNCTNTSGLMVQCINNTVAGLTNGSIISVWFNVTADPAVANEQNYEWIINTTDNATNESSSVLLSWIDGNVTVTAEPDTLAEYMNTQPLLNWTLHNGSDAVSGLLNYTVYHSLDGGNFTINGSTSTTSYNTTGLELNTRHWFMIATNDNAGNSRNSSSISTTIDTLPPAVYLNTTDYENFTTYYPTLSFNATDNFDDNMSCEIFVDGNGNGTRYALNGSAPVTMQVNSSQVTGEHSWYVACTDDAGNTGPSIPSRTFYVDGADVVIDSIYFTSPDSPNLIDSSNITIFAVVRNAGNINFTQNISVAFYYDGSLIGANQTITNETLTAGQTEILNITKSGSLKQNSFNHTLRAVANANGASELNSTNNDRYNYSVYVGYNVTITSIDAEQAPGDNVSITVMVRYPNGTGVSSLDKRNFTISDMYTGQTTHTWGGTSLALPLGTQNVYNDSFSELGSGSYTFKIATYNLTGIVEGGKTRAGPHTVEVDVQSNMTGRLFTGTDQDTYNLTAPMFDIIYKIRGESADLNGDTNLDESSSEDYNIYVVNNGYANLTNVNISVQSYDTTVFSAATEHSCSPTTPKTVVNDGSLVLICYISVTTKAVNSDDGGQVDIIAYGSYNGNRYTYDNDDLYIDVNNVVTTTTQTTTTTTTGTATSGTDYPNCEANADCFSDEYCNDHLVCKELLCSDDQEIVGHACVKKDTTPDAVVNKDYALSIVGAPENLEINHGESRNITFKIKNDGEKTLTDLKFDLRLKDDTANISDSYQIISDYPKTLEKGVIESIKLEINTADYSIGNYEMIAHAESNDAKTDLAFTMKVMPNDDEKTVINSTSLKLNSDYIELFDKLQVLLHKYENNTNLTELNITIADVKDHLEKATKSIADGDYLAAHEDLMSAESLMIDIKSKLDEQDIDAGNPGSHWIRNGAILIILVIVGLFGFQYYNENQRRTRSSGYHPMKGFRIKVKKGTFNDSLLRDISVLKMMIKGKNVSKPLKPAGFSYGNKEAALSHHKKTGDSIINRITGMFAKKKKSVNEKTLYDINSMYNKDKKKKMLVTF